MKFVCITKTFAGRLYYEGEVVECTEKPNEYFEEVKEETPPPEIVNEVVKEVEKIEYPIKSKKKYELK